jgi:hypothetical protein
MTRMFTHSDCTLCVPCVEVLQIRYSAPIRNYILTHTRTEQQEFAVYADLCPLPAFSLYCGYWQTILCLCTYVRVHVHCRFISR